MRRLIFSFALYGAILTVLFHLVPGRIFFASALFFFLCGAALVIKGYKESIKELRNETGSRLENYNNEKKGLENGIAKEDSRVFELRNKEIIMAGLYEITKKMSGDLTSNEIFSTLSAFLSEHFVFRTVGLLIIKDMEGYIKIEKVYKSHKNPEDEKEDTKTDYGDILTLFTKEKKELFIPKEEGRGFGAIPLLSENKFVGILTVEDLRTKDFDRFAIVAMQFALEMKKVLLYETVEALAITDSLTGLYTRRYLLERLNEELNRSKKHGFKFALLSIDIDDFKKCNDAHGHLVGDVILKEVSRIIKENTRQIDLVARYGGEEFSLILPETDKKGASLAAERIRKKIEENTFNAYDEKLKITVSAGFSVYPEDASDMDGIIENADKALYAAKGSGKNIVCEYKG